MNENINKKIENYLFLKFKIENFKKKQLYNKYEF